MINKQQILKEHYKNANGRRCGTEHIIDDNDIIVIYDHDAICLDSPAKARLIRNGRAIHCVTAIELEELDLEKLFSDVSKDSGDWNNEPRKN